MSEKKIWICKIGEVDDADLPDGAGLAMRNAVTLAYHDLTGEWPQFTFSGWGGRLDEGQRAYIEEMARRRNR